MRETGNRNTENWKRNEGQGKWEEREAKDVIGMENTEREKFF